MTETPKENLDRLERELYLNPLVQDVKITLVSDEPSFVEYHRHNTEHVDAIVKHERPMDSFSESLFRGALKNIGYEKL